MELVKASHTVDTDRQAEVHRSSISVLADLSEAWASGLLIDPCLAARCGRLVICSLTQIEASNIEDDRMDAAEVLACAYCWPHEKRGIVATADACLAARKSIVDACSKSLQQVLPRMLDCVLVNLGDGGDELMVTTGIRDTRRWRNALARVWSKASKRMTIRSMRGRALSRSSPGLLAAAATAGMKRSRQEMEPALSAGPPAAASILANGTRSLSAGADRGSLAPPPPPKFPVPRARMRSPSKQRSDPTNLELSSFPREMLDSQVRKLKMVESYHCRLVSERKKAMEERAMHQARHAADSVNKRMEGHGKAGVPKSSGAAAHGSSGDPESKSNGNDAAQKMGPVKAMPTRSTTPYWFLREDWEVSWTPDAGHGTSTNTRLGKLWSKPQSAAVGVIRRCTTGGDAMAACHGALPRSEFYNAPCDDMGKRQRIVLMLTTIADAVSLLHADLAQVLTPGVPIEHAELINEKKLQPAISTLAWHSGSGQASHGSSGGSSLQSASV